MILQMKQVKKFTSLLEWVNSFFLLVLWVEAGWFVDVRAVISLIRVAAFSFSWLSMLS